MAVRKIDEDEIVWKIALRVEDLATDEDRIPFLSGDLRKSIQSRMTGPGEAAVGSNLPYARAVHDGRPPIVIVPNVKKNPPYGDRQHRDPKRARLKFTIGGQTIFARSVHQKARKGKPFLREALDALRLEGWDWLLRDIRIQYGERMVRDFKRRWLAANKITFTF